jgi:hypothetical protein
MGKIADIAKSVAGIGLITITDSAVSHYIAQALQDIAELELWEMHLKIFGISNDDMDRYLETVTRLAHTSAIFSNRAVIEGGMALAKRRASKGESIFPDDTTQWAIELWNLIIESNEPEVRRTIWNLYGTIQMTSRDLRIDQWILEAEQLWRDNKTSSIFIGDYDE